MNNWIKAIGFIVSVTAVVSISFFTIVCTLILLSSYVGLVGIIVLALVPILILGTVMVKKRLDESL